MFQHIVVTPKKRDKTTKNEGEPEEIETLSLAPFTPIPKLDFHDVKIGASITKKICIRNPTGSNIMLYLQKAPPEERNVRFNWLQQMIQAASEEIFEITWIPLAPGAWRDVIQFTDNGRIRRDIPVAFKSIKPATKGKKIAVKTKKSSPLRKSPTKRVTTSSTSITTISKPLISKNLATNTSNHLQIPLISLQNPRRSTYSVKNKENFLSTTSTNNTYTINDPKPAENAKNVEEIFNDSLEMPTNNENTSLTTAARNWPDPYTPDRMQTSFCCSTGRKSNNNSHTSPLENISAETYIKGNASGGTYLKDFHSNLSGETYIKSNLSGGTYVKDSQHNVSGETYVKANLSGGTYVKDTSIANLADLQFSPCFEPKQSPKPFILANISKISLSPCVESPHLHCPLGIIAEESFLSGKSDSPMKKLRNSGHSTPTRRNSLTKTPKSSEKRSLNGEKPVNCTYDVKITPQKKLSPLKRLANGYNMKPMHLKQFLPKGTSPKLLNAITLQVTNTHNPDLFYNSVCNPYTLAQTSGVDPFIAVTMYYDPQWVDEQIIRFKNWLNTLLTPPKDLNCNNMKVDVAKMWQECRNIEQDKAPTKEEVSSKYNTNHLLQSLRHAATKLYRSTEVITVLSKAHGLVENNKLMIRTDKDLHQDVRIQKEVLQLFFCYNPLWLRIGLEQVYAVHIQLRSNSDFLTLSKFLMQHFFNNQYLLKKYRHKTSPKYAVEMKKVSLKKFLSLVYFLDQAKLQKLIPYDPCLFSKNAPIKESKEILLRFASELFFAVGDVSKPLRLVNYTLQYKQTYIHEYDYGVNSLGMDLKDGVRLTRVMEIILLERHLTDLLRVPAISRLQKIHNVKLAFDALKRAGYTIENKIEPKDIVEGHKEKTLSFLWQIIYKFQSPRYRKAVITVQTWWRSAAIQEKRRKLRELRFKKRNAAIKIQRWYRRHKLRQNLEQIIPIIAEIYENLKLNKAAIVIQANYRMFKCRKQYSRLLSSTLVIQKHFRNWYQFSHLRKKRNEAAKVIQRYWRGFSARKRFITLKQSVAVIGAQYLAWKEMRKHRNKFVMIKTACIIIQRRFRAKLMMKSARRDYLRLSFAVSVIQIKWKATLLMQKDKSDYLSLKNAAITVQLRFRAQQLMKTQRSEYLTLRNSVVNVQTRFRANLLMKQQRAMFLTLQKTVIFVQRRFRANCLCKTHRNKFNALKLAVKVIETRYKAKKQMQLDRDNFTRLKEAAILVQTKFKAILLARKCRGNYLALKNAVKVIGERYKALIMMRIAQNEYQKKRLAAIFVQRKFKAMKSMIYQRDTYLTLKNSVTIIQTYFKAFLLMKNERNHYLTLKKSVMLIQTRWRATQLMKTEQHSFQNMKNSAKTIDTWYQSIIHMRIERNKYEILKKTTIALQRRFRANKMAKQQRDEYLQLKMAVNVIETRYKARQQMKTCRNEFVQLVKALVVIQTRFRSLLIGRKCRQDFLALKNAVRIIETRYEALQLMRVERAQYERKQQAAILIQRRFRAQQQMLHARGDYLGLRDATITIQQQFRAHLLRNSERGKFLTMRNATLVIQRKWRATKEMELQRARFKITVQAIVKVQKWFRAVQIMRNVRNSYETLRNACVIVQRRFRANQAMKTQRLNYVTLRKHVLVIQIRFRAKKLMQTHQNEYQMLRRVVINVQQRFRAHLLMKQQRNEFLTMRDAAVKIQRFVRGYNEMKNEYNARIIKLRTILLLQVFGRGYIARLRFKEMNNPEYKKQKRLERLQKSSALKIQAAWRGYKVRSEESLDIAKIRQSLEAANRHAKPEDTIQQRTQRHIKIITSGKATMMQVLSTLEEVEKSTRLSQHTCVLFSKKGICEDLYDMLLSLNRSRTDIEASMAIAGIILNIAKFRETYKYAWIPSRLAKLITMMVSFCDKESNFFPKLATLLWVFGHDDAQKSVICEIPNFAAQMSKMLTLCERQQKMVSKSYKGKSVSLFVNYDERKVPLPMVKPDWGLDYPHAPYIFTNSVLAIRTLCHLFNV